MTPLSPATTCDRIVGVNKGLVCFCMGSHLNDRYPHR